MFKRAAIIMLALSCALPAQAFARVFVSGGVGVGTPYYGPAPYYAPYPYPYYAAPPPYYYGAAAPYAMPVPTPDDEYYEEDGRYCREYYHTVSIDGAPHRVWGHACRQADGQWQIVD